MKKRSAVAYSTLLLVAWPLASVWGQGVSGSRHDFTAGTGPNATYQFAASLCETCHVPHGGATGLAAPLWNHAVTAQSFTLYSSSTLNATMGQPDGVSRLCLSCHDGTVAVDSYGGTTGTRLIPSTSERYIGTDLSNDHPVSFTYDAALATADGGLQSPSGGTVGSSNLPLYSDKLQCGTCHNPHGTVNADFLRHAATTICTQCHIK